MPDLTAAELARRLGVDRATVARALRRGAELARADASLSPPPEPVNPGEPQLRWSEKAVRAWWPHRPPPGRPPHDRGGER